MDTVEILLFDGHHPVAWPLFWTALVVGLSTFIIVWTLWTRRILSGKWEELVAFVSVGATVICALLFVGTSVFLLIDTWRFNDSTIGESAVADHLKSEYGVTQIRGGSTGNEGGGWRGHEGPVDPEDVSHNTYSAETITVGEQVYKDCQVVFTDPETRDKKSYVTMKVTCHDQADQDKPVTLKPVK